MMEKRFRKSMLYFTIFPTFN